LGTALRAESCAFGAELAAFFPGVEETFDVTTLLASEGHIRE